MKTIFNPELLELKWHQFYTDSFFYEVKNVSNPDEGQVFVNFRNYEFIRSTRFLEPTSLVNEGLVKKKPNEGGYIIYRNLRWSETEG